MLTSLSLLVVFLLSSPAIGNSAEYAEGARAFERGNYTRAVDLWRRAAWVDDDIDAELELSDLYRQGKYVQKDLVEAYVWSYVALLNKQRLTDLFYVTNSLAVDVNDRFLNELPYLYVAMSSEERHQAEQRIVYILASRGAEGFFRLGEVYFSCWMVASPGGGSSARSSGSGREGIERGSQEPFDRGSRNYLLCRTSPGKFARLNGANVISENPVDAYAYFSIAEELRHKYARSAKDQMKAVLHIKGRNGLNTGQESADSCDRPPTTNTFGQDFNYNSNLEGYCVFGGTIVTMAERMAEFWEPPFEVYPKPYSDESRIDSDKEDALARVTAIHCSSIQEALLATGFYSGPIDDSCAGTTKRAMLQYQASLGAATTGELTPAQIVRLIRTAAVNGNAAGQFTLGTMYYYGYGVPVSYPRARTWFERAGDQRHPYALYNLGIMYRDGLGVDVDFGQAATYFMAARRANYPNERDIRCRLAEVNWPDEEGEHGASAGCSVAKK